jgi:acyl-CoA synthetase (AMP-forming)/AMP-acid ligase II
VLPNAELVAVYGSTEAEPIAHITQTDFTPSDFQAMQQGHGLLAGRPVPEIKLAILPDTVGQPLAPFTEADFVEAQLPPHCPGEIIVAGEIVVAGDHVQKRYLWGDDGMIKFTVDGTIWHRTGDAGYLDRDGRLWLLGRCAARITNGERVRYPFGLEAAAMASAGVERAAFVEVDGQHVLAIQAQPEVWAAIREDLQTALAGMEVDRLQQVDAIPMDTRHQSKVLYGELQELIRDG